jgi:hypothetical protein
VYVHGLRQNMSAIYARERLELYQLLSAIMASHDDKVPFLVAIAQQAFWDDEEQLANTIEAVSQKPITRGG